MIEQDTIRLLRECDAGVKMGVSSIEDVLDNVTDKEFEKLLTDCKNEHENLERRGISKPYRAGWCISH